MMGMKFRFLRRTSRNTASFGERRPVSNVVIATGGVLLAIGGVGEFVPGTSSNAAEPAVAVPANDPADLFDARSPGSRRYGWLSQTKQPRTGFDVGPSSKRVLPTGRRHPAVPTSPLAGSSNIPYVPIGGSLEGPPGKASLDVVTDTPSTVGFFGTPSGGSGPAIGGVSSSGGGTGGSGPGTGATSGVDTPTSPPTALAAVPEPATWMMLLIGFFGTGISLRRRQDRRRHGLC